MMEILLMVLILCNFILNDPIKDVFIILQMQVMLKRKLLHNFWNQLYDSHFTVFKQNTLICVSHFCDPKVQRPHQCNQKKDDKWYIEIFQVIVEENSYHYENAGYTDLKMLSSAFDQLVLILKKFIMFSFKMVSMFSVI